MIYKNIELHGVSEIYEAKGGIAFRRVPEAVIPHLSAAGQNAAVSSGGVELRALSHYLVSEAHKKHPDKYIFCIDMFRYFWREKRIEGYMRNHRAMIKEMAESFGSDKIIHLPALEMLGTYDLLSEDHVHPSIEGHFAISTVLSEKIKPYLDKI